MNNRRDFIRNIGIGVAGIPLLGDAVSESIKPKAIDWYDVISQRALDVIGKSEHVDISYNDFATSRIICDAVTCMLDKGRENFKRSIDYLQDKSSRRDGIFYSWCALGFQDMESAWFMHWWKIRENDKSYPFKTLLMGGSPLMHRVGCDGLSVHHPGLPDELVYFEVVDKSTLLHFPWEREDLCFVSKMSFINQS